MSAATAKRRRKQAVQGYNHLALLGKRGSGNSRPIYHLHSKAVLDAREAHRQDKASAYRIRQSRAAAKRKG